MAKMKADRTEESTDITRVNPSFLAEYAEQDDSLALMGGYRIIPRIKVIQGQTSQDLKKQFGEGSAILRPGDSLVAKQDQSFLFNPYVFIPEFCKWADRKDPEQRVIIDRSYDPTSALAKRATSKNPDDRIELYPGDEKLNEKDKKYFKWVEHLNFIGAIYGEHELAGQIIAISFSRGEYMQGKAFINACMRRTIVTELSNGQRKKIQAPLWSQIWQITPAQGQSRIKSKGSWFGLDYKAPEGDINPFVTVEEAKVLRETYNELKRDQQENRLRVDHDSAGEDQGSSESDADAEAVEQANGKY